MSAIVVSMRRFRTALLFFGIALLASGLGLEGSMLYTRYRARGLLRGVEKLRLGESTTQDVQKLFRDYGAWAQKTNDSVCAGQDCSYYALVVYNTPLEYLLRVRWFVSQARTLWSNQCCNFTGWRGLAAGIHVADGRVVAIDIHLGARRKDGFLMTGRAQEVMTIPEALDTFRAGYRPGRFHLTAPGGGAGVEAMIDLRADASAREHAFDFNLRCMASWSGCPDLSEIMPSVWSDFQEDLRQHSPPNGK